jgi:hypothetical protein
VRPHQGEAAGRAGFRVGGSDGSGWLDRVYARLASSLKWTFSAIDSLTLPEAEAIFVHWQTYPPENELAAIRMGYGKELTMEEKIKLGAAGPADLLARAGRKGKFVHRLGGGGKGKAN